MKKIQIVEYKIVPEKSTRKITNVIHDIPVWMYEDRPSDITKNCPVCNQEIGMIIAHGVKIETCSVIQLDNVIVKAIHTECYHKLTDLEP